MLNSIIVVMVYVYPCIIHAPLNLKIKPTVVCFRLLYIIIYNNI